MLPTPLLLLTYTLLATHPASTHRPRKDPFIWCEPGPGPTPAQGLPAPFSEAIYPDKIALCSFIDGVPSKNLGCVCASTGAPLYCRDRLANERLWSALYWDEGVGEMGLARYCVSKCDCLALRQQGMGDGVGGGQVVNVSGLGN